MEPQNLTALDFLLESINTFINSSQTLDTNFLSELAALVDDKYNEKVNEYRKQRETMLNDLTQSIGWRKYVLNLFQIAYFSQTLSPRLLENILFENSSTIFQKGVFGINTDEYIVLLAANVCCLINGNFSATLKKRYLVRSLENLCKLEVQGKEEIKSALDQYCISCLDKATASQAFGLTLIFKQIILEDTLNELDINQLEHYLNHISNLGLVTLTSGNDAFNYSSGDFAYVIEIINCLSELCYYLVERWLKELSSDEDDESELKIKEEDNFHDSILFQATTLLQQIIELLEKVLNIDISNTNVKLLSLGENQDLNNVLNRSKKYAIETLNLFVSYTFQIKKQHSHKFNQQEVSIINNFVQRFEDHLKFLLTQLHQVVIGLYSSDFLLNNKQSDLIQSVFVLLNRLIIQYEYYSIFLDNRIEVIVNIVLNLLLVTKQDLEEFKQNPRDFALHDQDIASKRESGSLKASVAQFLYNYCAKIDGTLSWVCLFLFKSLDLSFGKPGDYEDLLPFEKSLFFTKADNENRVETSLLGLLITAELIEKRADLIEKIDSFFKNDFHIILETKSDLVLSRMCLFLMKMTPVLFQKNDKLFADAMKFLFDCLVNFKNPAISTQALNSIELLTGKPEEFDRVEGIVYDIHKYLERIIAHANHEPYFHFLLTFLYNYRIQISKFSSNLIKLLTERVWSEFNNLGHQKINIVIDKCLQIICMMVSIREVIDENFKSFEESLIHLFGLLDQIHKIEFHDQLILIATEIIKMIPINTPIFNIIQKHLFDLLQKNDEVMGLLFDLFYYWCKNGRYIFSEANPALIKDMVLVCLTSIESFPVETLKKEYKDFSLACVCLQIIIQFFDKDQLAPCINEILLRLDRVEKKLCSDGMRAVGFRFFQIYYCLINYYPTETLRHLTERELMLVLIETIPFFYLEYFKEDSYSRKVISIGLISLFHNRSSYIDTNLTKACFTSLIKVLEYIPSQNNGKRPRKNKNQLEEEKNDIVDLTSDETLNVPDFPYAAENNKIIQKLNEFELPILQIEEYQLFSKIYDQFKQANEEFNNVMMDILDFEMKKSLITILSTKNVEAKDSSKTVIRKQMIIKKRANNPNANVNSGMLLGNLNANQLFTNTLNPSNQNNNMFTE